MRRFAVALTILFTATAISSSSPARAASPDQNGAIVFVATSEGGIWSMLPDGTQRVQLTDDAFDSNPRFSPDGRTVAFQRASVAKPAGSVWLMDANGENEREIPGTDRAGAPAWSPDGTMLAVALAPTVDDSRDVWTMHLDGTELTNVTHGENITVFDPVWSPDGQRIAYLNRDTQLVEDIYSIRTDGGDIKQLTDTPDEGEAHPSWSPDGTMIAFDRFIEDSGQYDVLTMKSDGTEEHNLTDDERDNGFPSWSPDGTQIAYLEDSSVGDITHSRIALMSADGDGRHEIAASLEGDYSPDWGPGAALGLIWGDNDCSRSIDPLDALATLIDDAGLNVTDQVPQGDCAFPLGAALHTVAFGTQTFGDLDCAGGVHGSDAILILRHVLNLPPANLPDCPAVGGEVALQPQ